MSTAAAPAVLFVDDEAEMLKSILRLVRGLPIRPLFARSGAEALLLLAQERPEAMLTDYQMPGLDGVELIRQVQARHPSVRCAIHSGNPPPWAAGLGVGVVNKPCEPANFRRFVLSLAGAGEG